MTGRSWVALLRPKVLASAARVARLRLLHRGRVEVWLDSYLGPGCVVVCPPGARIVLRAATLSRHVTVDASSGSTIELGSSFVGPGTIIAAKGSVMIGDGCQIADGVAIRDHNHRHDADTPLAALEFTVDPVVIGDDVWLGSKAVIIAGVTIADHAVVGAGAVVTKPVLEWQKVGGVPARPLSRR